MQDLAKSVSGIAQASVAKLRVSINDRRMKVNCWRTQRGRGLIRSLDFRQWRFFLRPHLGGATAFKHGTSLSWI